MRGHILGSSAPPAKNSGKVREFLLKGMGHVGMCIKLLLVEGTSYGATDQTPPPTRAFWHLF